MIGSMTLSQAAIAYGGTLLFPDCVFTEVSTDSRTLQTGQLFVALEGENFDGHRFLKEVAGKACGLVVSKPDKSLTIPQWVVADTTAALGQLARLNLERFDGRLIALTGSAGKTTVKEMLAAILAHRGATLATKGNLNNHIGVPKTIFELTAEHRYAVIEMGASGPGEIDYLCRIARPDVALITNVLPAHIAGFGSESVIAETKGAVYSNLKDGGTAVINLDDVWHQKWMLMSGKAKLLTCSLTNTSADIRATDIDLGTAEGSRFVLHLGRKSTPVVLPLPGRHNVANALIAAGAAFAAGAALVDIVWGLENIKPVKGRMQLRAGIGGCAVLDDSYNANPGSVKAAIDVLALKPGKRVLVLGDMAELGSLSTKSHREMGVYARARGIEEFYTTGQYADHSARGFGDSAKVFASKDELVEALKENLDSATTVLVKGSRSAAMDLLVARIIVEEEHASVAG